MSVREGGHAYAPGTESKRGKDGRNFVLCATCGMSRRGAAHQRLDPRSKAPAPPPPAPTPVHLVRVREAREIAMLRLALDAVLDRPDIGWTLRQRALEARRAVDLPADEAPRAVAYSGAAPSVTTFPSRKSQARWVRRAIPGAYWDIARAALDCGFIPERTGTGHVRFRRDSQGFSLSTTIKEGPGRGLDNARAAARRAGVTC